LCSLRVPGGFGGLRPRSECDPGMLSKQAGNPSLSPSMPRAQSRNRPSKPLAPYCQRCKASRCEQNTSSSTQTQEETSGTQDIGPTASPEGRHQHRPPSLLSVLEHLSWQHAMEDTSAAQRTTTKLVDEIPLNPCNDCRRPQTWNWRMGR
jgi:hypothetical protein